MAHAPLPLGHLSFAHSGQVVPAPQQTPTRVVDVQCVLIDDKPSRETFWVKVRLEEAEFVLSQFLHSLRQNIQEKLRKLNIDACEITLKYLETNKPGKVFDIADSQAQWELFCHCFFTSPETIEFSAHIRRPPVREDDKTDGRRASTGKRKRGPTSETVEDLELLNTLKENDRKGFKFGNTLTQPEMIEPKRTPRQVELLEAFRKHVTEVWPGAVVINERLVTCPTCGKNRKLNHLRWIDTIKAGHGEKCRLRQAAAAHAARDLAESQHLRLASLTNSLPQQAPQHVPLQQMPGLPQPPSQPQPPVAAAVMQSLAVPLVVASQHQPQQQQQQQQ